VDALLEASLFAVVGKLRQIVCNLLTPGGTAPWLPWQSLQVGAERSPLSVMAFQWTEVLYFATWSVGIL
jgi:hypothetical protein